MKSKLLIVVPIIVALLYLPGCVSIQDKPAPQPSSETSADKPFGGKKDAHGCILKDGYSWCDVKNKCIKLAEEQCVKEESYKMPKRNYYLIEDALAEKNDLKKGSFRLGIKSLQQAHFRGVVSGMEGIILAVKENNDWIIVVDTVYSGKNTYTCKEVAEHYFPADLISDCVNE